MKSKYLHITVSEGGAVNTGCSLYILFSFQCVGTALLLWAHPFQRSNGIILGLLASNPQTRHREGPLEGRCFELCDLENGAIALIRAIKDAMATRVHLGPHSRPEQ